MVCGKCGAVFSIAKNRTEWDLKTPMQRGLFVFKVLAISAFLGFGTGGLITELVARYLSAVIPLTLSGLIGAGLWCWILSNDMRRAIKESRARMMDHKYRQSLARLGLIGSTNLNRPYQ